MATFVRPYTAKDTLFSELLDVSVDIAPVYSNDSSHFVSCNLRISFN